MFIKFANTDFQCPYCNQQYEDTEEKYSKRAVKNKNQYTTITCTKCERKFGMTPTTEGKLASFPLGGGILSKQQIKLVKEKKPK